MMASWHFDRAEQEHDRIMEDAYSRQDLNVQEPVCAVCGCETWAGVCVTDPRHTRKETK